MQQSDSYKTDLTAVFLVVVFSGFILITDICGMKKTGDGILVVFRQTIILFKYMKKIPVKYIVKGK